ncbi:N-acetylmuramoyl-L-alanine amidase [candidate division KSB1 bacterium]|nr:N-acetylmuramoyl-L-alanine amidase [candidate division KSB1 bacterium]
MKKYCSLLLFVFLFGFIRHDAVAENISVIDKSLGKSMGTIESVRVGHYDFVSATGFAEKFNFPYELNFFLKKITIQTPQNLITINALIPYILIDNAVYQMPVNTLYKDKEFYIPIKFFIEILNGQFQYEMEYNETENALLVTTNLPNIADVSIEEMDNGVLIQINSLKKFSTSNIFTSESNGWFYVDFFGGRVDTLRSFIVENNIKRIKQIIPIQLSEETARLSFRVLPEIKEKNVYLKTPNEVIITLRTKKKLSNDILADLEKEREKWNIDVIIIDAGHGGRDPGAIGPNDFLEKRITFAIAKELKAELQKKLDVKVLMTRESDNFIPLIQRTRFANNNQGKLFLSIHVDSNPSSRIHGHTVYILGPAKTEEARRVAQYENSVIRLEEDQNQYADLSEATFILAANAQSSFLKESEDFASILDNEIKNKCESFSHGVKQAGFQVLYGASMPSILLETAFLTNRYDIQKLKTKTFQKSMARALCDGIVKFKERYETYNH